MSDDRSSWPETEVTVVSMTSPTPGRVVIIGGVVNDEVVAIDRTAHTVTTHSTIDGEELVVPYDKLILSMGAAPMRPPIPGYERVRTLRTVEDASSIAAEVGVAPESAVVIRAGFIGLEMAENLVAQGLDTTVVEAASQVLTPLDPELAVLVCGADERRGTTRHPDHARWLH
jgi:NADPH-dependent 2,4-dienoyl-CoA reductase/sulfur reductase-like enzyme